MIEVYVFTCQVIEAIQLHIFPTNVLDLHHLQLPDPSHKLEPSHFQCLGVILRRIPSLPER